MWLAVISSLNYLILAIDLWNAFPQYLMKRAIDMT